VHEGTVDKMYNLEILQNFERLLTTGLIKEINGGREVREKRRRVRNKETNRSSPCY